MGSEFERIYETYYMKVYSYVLSRCRDPHTAEEITQKTFYRALTAKKPFRAESSLFSWLCSIAKNALIDEIRVAKHKAEVNEEPVSEDDPVYGVELQDQIVRIHEILHAMEEPYKEVFSLRVFGELPFGPIGRLFGKSENWARVAYYRARLKIAERMGTHED